jgi:putative flippase GtrA
MLLQASVKTPDLPARPTFLQSFSRSQVSSFTATLADFALLFGLVEIFHVWYVLATAIGALAGAITNFLMNRHWSFEATHGHPGHQLFRYSVVSVGSLILNTGGVYLATDYGGIHYAISVAVVSLVVGFAFNFPLHRHYVFR